MDIFFDSTLPRSINRCVGSQFWSQGIWVSHQTFVFPFRICCLVISHRQKNSEVEWHCKTSPYVKLNFRYSPELSLIVRPTSIWWLLNTLCQLPEDRLCSLSYMLRTVHCMIMSLSGTRIRFSTVWLSIQTGNRILHVWADSLKINVRMGLHPVPNTQWSVLPGIRNIFQRISFLHSLPLPPCIESVHHQAAWMFFDTPPNYENSPAYTWLVVPIYSECTLQGTTLEALRLRLQRRSIFNGLCAPCQTRR